MRFGKLKKLMLAACSLLSVALFICGVYILNTLNAQGQSAKKYSDYENKGINYPDYGENNSSSITSEEPVNLLILGLDSEEARSDVILLANYSPTLGEINLLSIPRDTKVYVKGKAEKINALISLGGIRLVIGMVEKITGLEIDYYVILNFAGFRELVDALGGVLFEVPFDMDYDDPDQNLHIHLKKGVQLLDGKKAEQLVRYRKGNNRNEGYEDADIGRIKMQQQFLNNLIRQKLKLKYISKVDDIFYILHHNMKTNIRIDDVRHYLKYVENIRLENVQMYTLPGDAVYTDNLWYYIYYREKTKKLINEKFY